MDKVKVSILMSVYNGQRFLHKAMESILNQTFRDFEFIIVNDASTDNSKAIIQSYADQRVVFIENAANIGLTKSLNKAWKRAQGKYIARQDADDISTLDRLKIQVDFLDAHPNIGLVGSYATFIDENGEEFYLWKTKKGHDDIVDGLSRGSCFCHGSVMLRKECMDSVRGYRNFFKYAQDYDLWSRLIETCKTANIGQVLYKFRRTEETLSRRYSIEQANYWLLAYGCAQERRAKGRDSLTKVDKNNLEKNLVELFKLDRRFIKDFKSNVCFSYALETLSLRSYLESLKFLFISLYILPKKWRLKEYFKSFIQSFRKHDFSIEECL